jgi:hypothetical protein
LALRDLDEYTLPAGKAVLERGHQRVNGLKAEPTCLATVPQYLPSVLVTLL